MATTTARDVPLTLSVETIGAAAIKQLKDDVAALGKQGADVAPEFDKLSAAIDTLAQGTALAKTLGDVTQQVEQLSASEVEAAAKTDKLRSEFNDLSATTTALRAAETALAGDVKVAKDALFEKQQTLRTLRLATGDNTAEIKKYSTEIIEAKGKVRELSQSYKEAKAETTAAATAESDHAAKLKRSATELTSITAKLSERKAVLSDTVGALNTVGVATDSVAAAEASLKTTYDQVSKVVSETAAAQKKAAADAVAAADAELAAKQKLKQEHAEYAAKVDVLNAQIKASQQRVNDELLASRTAAKQAGDAIQSALGTVGVRSAQDIQAEIAKVRKSLDLLKSTGTLTGSELDAAFAKGASKIKLLERDLREATNQMTLADKSARAFSGAMGQFTVASVAANAIGYLYQKVTDLGKAFIDSVVQGDQLKRGLTAVYGSAEVAASQIDVLRKVASSSGVAVGGLTTDFVRFSASMKSANIPLDQSNALFQAVTRASASLGLSAESTSGMLNALGQMASKGVVSMEELRQQLGDRLPGALGLAASGMGITESQLIKLVESGTLATREFIGPFTEGLKQMQGETDGVTNAWERFKGALTTVAQTVGEAGFAVLLTGALKALGAVVATVALAFQGFAETLFLVGRAAVAAYAAFKDPSGAWEFLKQSAAESGARLDTTKQAFAALIDPTKQVAAAQTQAAGAMMSVAEQARITSAATEAMAKANIDSKVAIEIASNATLNAAANIIQYKNAINEKVAAQSIETEGLQKIAKAIKEESTERIQVASLLGNETALREAESLAADRQAVALQKVALSQKAEIDLLLLQRQHMIEVAMATDGNTKAIQGNLLELDKKIAKAAPELEQMKAAASAALAEAAARKVATDALKDHAGQQDIYRTKMAEVQAQVKLLQADEAAGKDVKEALRKKTEELAYNTALYGDALKDTVKRVTEEATANRDIAASRQIALNIQVDQIKKTIEQAQVTSDYATVISATKDLIALETKALKESTDAKVKDLEAKIKLNNTNLEAAKLNGTYTESMQAATDAANKLVEAEIQKAKALVSTADSTKVANDATKEINKAMTEMDDASKGLTGTLSAETQAKVDGAQANLESAQARYEDAKASGDEKAAAAALVEVKKAELELAKVMAEAKREEAKASRDLADAKKREAEEAARTAAAIAEEISKAKEVTAEMQKQLDTAKVNAVAKAGAAKEAYAHADALDVEAKGLEKGVEVAERALKTAEKAFDRMRDSANKASTAVGSVSKSLSNAEISMQLTVERMDELIDRLAHSTDLSYDLAKAENFARQQASYLGDEKLSGLRSAIQDAKNRMEALRDEANSTLNSIQDELDQLTSNFDDIENRKYEAQKDDINAKLEEARAVKDAEAIARYQKALDTLEKVHALRLADAKKREQQAVADAKEAAAEEATKRVENGYDNVDSDLKGLQDPSAKAAVDAARDRAYSDGLKNRSSRGSAVDSTSARDTAQSGSKYTVNITIGGVQSSINVASSSDASRLQAILTQLASAQGRAVT